MVTRPAPRALRGYVRDYTGYEEWSAEPLCRREVPSADVTLILSPDSELRLPERHTSFVAALHDRCALVEHPGEQRGVEVRLTPLGAHALFGVPMHELTNRVVELDELGVRGGWSSGSGTRTAGRLASACSTARSRRPRRGSAGLARARLGVRTPARERGRARRSARSHASSAGATAV